MITTERGSKITVDLGSRELYKRLRMAAVEQDMTVREIVTEAVTFWLGHEQLVEDLLAQEKIERIDAGSPAEFIPHAEVKRAIREERQPHREPSSR